MKTTYDRDADALYITFSDTKIVETEELRPGVMFDFDAQGGIVGIEILDVKTKLSSGADLSRAFAA